MRISGLQIENFRGSGKKFTLKLGGKSVCILGENGKGKSTIADALDLWLVGKLERFSSEECKLDATKRLGADGPTAVTCVGMDKSISTRTVKSATKSDFTVKQNPSGSDLPFGLSILRHRQLADFMDQSAGERKRELMRLLGLEPLQGFRDELVSARNTAKNDFGASTAEATDAGKAFKLELDGENLVPRANRLLKEAGLAETVRAEEDVIALDLAATPTTVANVDRGLTIDAIQHGLGNLDPKAIAEWNAAIETRESISAAVVTELIDAGQRVLEIWEDATCPLCESAHDHDALVERLGIRKNELAKFVSKFNAAQESATALLNQLDKATEILESLATNAPKGGWAESANLKEFSDEVKKYRDSCRARLKSRDTFDAMPDWKVKSRLEPLREDLKKAEPSSQAAAVSSLARLRLLLSQKRDAEALDISRKRVHDALELLTDVAEAKIEDAIKNEIARLGGQVASFFAQIVANPIYSDTRLVYSDKRSGGVKFAFKFNGSHEISPPERVASESQMNALGLAFFLAKHRLSDDPEGVLVLDDIVNSFDANHRKGIADLLNAEFADCQVILLTHDQAFARYAQRTFSGWRFEEVVGWTPDGGPVLASDNARDQLEAQLKAGQSAAQLGGIARRAVERSLSDPMAKLKLDIEFRPGGTYVTGDYVAGIRRTLVRRNSTLDIDAVLTRIEGDTHFTNLGSHDRPQDPQLSENDLWQVVGDIDELSNRLICGDCGTEVWHVEKSSGTVKFACKCGKLTA